MMHILDSLVMRLESRIIIYSHSQCARSSLIWLRTILFGKKNVRGIHRPEIGYQTIREEEERIGLEWWHSIIWKIKWTLKNKLFRTYKCYNSISWKWKNVKTLCKNDSIRNINLISIYYNDKKLLGYIWCRFVGTSCLGL